MMCPKCGKEMRRLSVQQQGRCVKFCKRSAENRDDGNCEDHSLKGKGGVF